MIKTDHDNKKGDVDEEEDLCAVPPHIMRIMQVQKNMRKILMLMLMIIITSVTLVMTKVMVTRTFLKFF